MFWLFYNMYGDALQDYYTATAPFLEPLSKIAATFDGEFQG